ncbi:phage major capsid protein, P2 family [Xanthomonas hortorum]|uniref:phage major capsid protein, P2 family n=1 Tax=Xanthomonas hortorum TaxID=56454 RepID=UPI001F44CFBD|nr:phage major capsid protein, P2 family [Xanthomonas hortorum]MCE4364860.1 phage major capsid protein, P2 family [Xanthomonas hortorum]
MQNATRLQFNQFVEQIAKLNGITSALHSFAVDPTVQQKLETRMQESSEFLSKINIIPVDELSGQKVGIGVTGSIASRTDTGAGKTRTPRNVAALDKNEYVAKKTDFDTAIPYALLDAWAKFPDFQARLRDAIVKRQALDRLQIGFNGTHAAADTDRAAYPLLEDVNIGWLQQYRTNAAQRVLASGKTAGKMVIGTGDVADYRNLDALVFDVVSNLLDPWHRKDPSLVVVLGRDLMHDKYFPMVNKDQPASEKIATDLILSQRRVGGLQVAEVPYLPDGALMVTSLANLSIYYQTGGRRRYIQEVPARDRIENYESSNDAYVVEDYGLGCVVEHIEIEA